MSATQGLRVAVLISGSGTNLQALIDAQPQGQLGGEVVVVLSNRADAKGLERARRAGIPRHVIDHREFPSREAFDRAILLTLDQYRPDLVLLAGFMRILTPGFVTHYHGRMMNIHPSLLPKYPGLHTHRRALEARDRYHGVTVHFVTDELDGGPPIVQARVEVLPEDDESSLAERVQREEHRLYPQAVRWFAEGRIQLQNGRATFDGETLPAQGLLMDTLAER